MGHYLSDRRWRKWCQHDKRRKRRGWGARDRGQSGHKSSRLHHHRVQNTEKVDRLPWAQLLPSQLQCHALYPLQEHARHLAEFTLRTSFYGIRHVYLWHLVDPILQHLLRLLPHSLLRTLRYPLLLEVAQIETLGIHLRSKLSLLQQESANQAVLLSHGLCSLHALYSVLLQLRAIDRQRVHDLPIVVRQSDSCSCGDQLQH